MKTFRAVMGWNLPDEDCRGENVRSRFTSSACSTRFRHGTISELVINNILISIMFRDRPSFGCFSVSIIMKQ
jgi:hypothetical protein